MRELLISALALATLAACSKQEDSLPGGGGRKIEVQAGLTATVSTKSDLTGSVEGETFPANTTKVFFVTAYRGTAPDQDWSAPYFKEIAVNSGEGSVLELAPAQYYPANGDKLYFYAYSPKAASVTDGTGTTAPVVHYTIDGSQDILAAQDIRGIASVAQAQPQLAFAHKLKQVVFRVMRDASFEEGVNITSVEILGAKTSANLALNTGALSWEAVTGDLTVYSDGQGREITAEPAVIGAPMMFEPGETFTVRLVAGGVTYDDVAVTLTGERAGEAGVAHEVTFTFKRGAVAPAAQITEWTDGGETASGEASAYPYVVDGRIIVSADDFGPQGAFLHPVWSTTPRHYATDGASVLDAFNTLSRTLEVAAEDAGEGTYDAVECPEGWRMPTANELLAIARLQNKLSAVTALPTDGKYWSATATAEDYTDYWCVVMDNAGEGVATPSDETARLRCVRDLENTAQGD